MDPPNKNVLNIATGKGNFGGIWIVNIIENFNSRCSTSYYN